MSPPYQLLSDGYKKGYGYPAEFHFFNPGKIFMNFQNPAFFILGSGLPFPAIASVSCYRGLSGIIMEPVFEILELLYGPGCSLV